MKLILTFLMFSTVLFAYAQKRLKRQVPAKNDNYLNTMNAEQPFKFLGPGKSFKGTITVDGKAYKGTFGSIKPEAIWGVDSLSLSEDTSHVFGTSTDDMINVITKKSIADQYKEAFSKFSVDYKNYLFAHQNSDSGIVYMNENDGRLIANSKNRLHDLYHLSGKKIENVKLSKIPDSKGKTLIIAGIKTKE
jgi:hypothetical protein